MFAGPPIKMKKKLLAVGLTTLLAAVAVVTRCHSAGVQINGNQISSTTAITIATMTASRFYWGTGSTRSSGTISGSLLMAAGSTLGVSVPSVTSTSTAHIGGNLSVNGTANITGFTNQFGYLTEEGNDIFPLSDNYFDIGIGANRFKNGLFAGQVVSSNVQATSATFSSKLGVNVSAVTSTATAQINGAVSITGALEVDGLVNIIGYLTLAGNNIYPATDNYYDLGLGPNNRFKSLILSGDLSAPSGTFASSITVSGSGQFKVGASTFGASGFINSSNYEMATTTITGTGGANAFTVFSSMEISSNTFAKTGDTIVIECSGTSQGGNVLRNVILTVDGVAISSRGASAQPTGESGWWVSSAIMRTSANKQVRTCRGTFAGGCVQTAASGLGFGTMTLTDANSHFVACAGSGGPNNVSGEVSFLNMFIDYKKGRSGP